MNDDLPYWIAFHRVNRLGRVRFGVLESHFGELKHAWEASESELRASRLDDRTIAEIIRTRADADPMDELERLERHKVVAYTWHDPEYPARLRQIDDMPPVLYVKGTLKPEDEISLAVVGTRKATTYGREVTREFVRDLVPAGLTITSGLALGIDTIAHHAALQAAGRTIAVLGSGVDIIYPTKNVDLSREIADNGALISDYPIGIPPLKEHFPRRNRIMSGISLGTLVIEGNEKSGALITARQALDQNREVFAVPGSALAERSRGPNLLIQRGEAKLVLHAEDILQELNMPQGDKQLNLPSTPEPVDEEQAAVLRLLSHSPVHIDEIYRASGMSMPEVSSTLTMLELNDLVRQVGGMRYTLTREAHALYESHRRDLDDTESADTRTAEEQHT